MIKNNSHISFVDKSNDLNILLFGFTEIFFSEFRNYLTKHNCIVYSDLNEIKNKHFSYIFHFNNLRQVTKTITIAQNQDAKFIFLTTEENLKIINKVINPIKANVAIYVIKIANPDTKEEVKKIINKIFQQIFLSKETSRESLHYDKNKYKATAKKRLPKPIYKLLPFLIVVLLVTVYFASICLAIFSGLHKLELVNEEIKNNNFKASWKNANNAQQFFLYSKKTTSFFLPIIQIISSQEAQTIEDSLNILNLLAKTGVEASYVSSLAQNTGESIVSGRASLHQSQLEELQTEIKQLNNDVSKLSSEIKSIKTANSKIIRWLHFNDKLSYGETTLSQINNLLSLSTKFTQILPQVLGYEKPATFLLLFQNNAELRPTGGFIGSFGWVTFSKGRLIEFKTEDVYTADGQLKGHIEPPEPIKKYLQQENWYLRDSNFDPDFAVSASQAEWFLKHEMNLTFDGVIAFDLNGAQEILRGLNGVVLSDYNEEVNADNLFLKTQTYSESNFFPGSTQKRDFLGSLARAMFIKLTSDKISWANLLQKVKTALDQKHILVYLHNTNAQQIVEEAGWGGRIASVSCQEKNCLADYLTLVEANMGINKANFLIKRDVRLILSKISNKLNHELIVNYTNNSPEKTYPGGTYFSYTRILIPKEASIQEILINNEKLSGEEIVLLPYQDKISVGFPLAVEALTQKKVKLVYEIPSSQQPINLQLLVQKQPGIQPYNLEITVNKDKAVKRFEIDGDKLISFLIDN